MRISLVVAATENGVIGHQNKLLWHLPDDLKFFKRTTTGHVIIMGRKTWESVGSKPLPNRTNVVITSNDSLNLPENVYKFSSLSDAIDTFRTQEEIFIVGGASIYEQALPLASVVYLTLVHTNMEGDTHFLFKPEHQWKLVASSYHASDEKHAFAFTFQIYNRV